jgi:hypothetical protein
VRFVERPELRLKLGLGHSDFVQKPKWMRWTTFERRRAEIEAADHICDLNFLAAVARLTQRAQR